MSQDRQLNGGQPTDVERALRVLTPESLELNRDELFFHAGVAAGTRRRKTFGFLWPAVAASLLVLCSSLGLSLYRQTRFVELASTSAPATTSGRSSDSANGFTAFNGDYLVNSRISALLRVASLDGLPAGRLTARGWVEPSPLQFEQMQDPSRQRPSRSPHRPSTYLDLLPLQQEG